MEKLVNFLKTTRKAIAAGANAVLVTSTVFADGAMTNEERLMLVAAWGAVLAVYQLTNDTK